MATIKSFTDISQSRKLAEILPIESADMRYAPFGDTHPWILDGEVKLLEKGSIPCWSLAALLDVLPYKESLILAINDFQGDRKERFVVGSVEHDKYDCYADNPVDACVTMIELLYEQKLL